MPDDTDSRARIVKLEAELADAKAELDRLRPFEREVETLRDRVNALHHQIITLRPPPVPIIRDPGVSGPPEVMTPSLRVEETARTLANSKRERAVLGAVILVAVAATAAIVLLDRAQQEDRGALRTGARGLGVHTAEPLPPPEPLDAGASRDGGSR